MTCISIFASCCCLLRHFPTAYTCFRVPVWCSGWGAFSCSLFLLPSWALRFFCTRNYIMVSMTRVGCQGVPSIGHSALLSKLEFRYRLNWGSLPPREQAIFVLVDLSFQASVCYGIRQALGKANYQPCSLSPLSRQTLALHWGCVYSSITTGSEWSLQQRQLWWLWVRGAVLWYLRGDFKLNKIRKIWVTNFCFNG